MVRHRPSTRAPSRTRASRTAALLDYAVKPIRREAGLGAGSTPWAASGGTLCLSVVNRQALALPAALALALPAALALALPAALALALPAALALGTLWPCPAV